MGEGDARTRRSAPDCLSIAQSSGLWPGVSATFSRFFAVSVGILVVVGGGISEEPAAGTGTPRPPLAPPGTVSRGGGGGMEPGPVVKRRGTARVGGAGEGGWMRWALERAGKAGGVSDSVSVSSFSSSSWLRYGRDAVGVAGLDGGGSVSSDCAWASGRDDDGESHERRYEAILRCWRMEWGSAYTARQCSCLLDRSRV